MQECEAGRVHAEALLLLSSEVFEARRDRLRSAESSLVRARNAAELRLREFREATDNYERACRLVAMERE